MLGKILKKNIKQNIVRFFRRKEFQPLWEKLFHISKIGMNFWNGAYIRESGEIYAMKYIKNSLKHKNNLIIFDVGANIGLFVKVAEKVFTCSKKIYSFEPSNYTYKLLRTNIEKWEFSNFVNTYNIGFGEKRENVELYSSGKGSSIASIYNLKDTSKPFDEKYKETIKLETIDDFCNNNKIKELDFLKIDIEGHEYKALLGAKEMIKLRRIKFIQFEFGECHIASKTFFRDFHNMLCDNYIFYRIVSNGLRPIKKYSTDLEVFNTINYLAELK